MSIASVSDSKIRELEERFRKLGVREEDLSEEFIRGSGAGGQKINKTSVVVQLRHLPSGVAVRCQESRSQALNRFMARRLLADKLEEIVFKEKSARQQLSEKIRRQKRRRSRRAKDKMLESKRHQSAKKSLRGRPSRDD